MGGASPGAVVGPAALPRPRGSTSRESRERTKQRRPRGETIGAESRPSPSVDAPNALLLPPRRQCPAPALRPVPAPRAHHGGYHQQCQGHFGTARQPAGRAHGRGGERRGVRAQRARHVRAFRVRADAPRERLCRRPSQNEPPALPLPPLPPPFFDPAQQPPAAAAGVATAPSPLASASQHLRTHRHYRQVKSAVKSAVRRRRWRTRRRRRTWDGVRRAYARVPSVPKRAHPHTHTHTHAFEGADGGKGSTLLLGVGTETRATPHPATERRSPTRSGLTYHERRRGRGLVLRYPCRVSDSVLVSPSVAPPGA